MIASTAGAGAYRAIQNLVSSSGASATTGAGIGPSGLAATTATGGGTDFGAYLKGALEGVQASGKAAEGQAMAAATGKADLVDVVTAVAESETALQTLVSVRDRMISAYEEIMRMPI